MRFGTGTSDSVSASTASDAFFDIRVNLRFSIKVAFGYECNDFDYFQYYRFQHADIVDGEHGEVSLQKLLDVLEKESGRKPAPPFTYEDKEGDEISVNSSRALHDAIDQFLDQPCLVLRVNEYAPNNSNSCHEISEAESEGSRLIRQLMKPSPRDPVWCHGIFFERGDVLAHLFNRFRDHVTETDAPRCVSIEGRGSMLHWKYEIDELDVVSEWLAIDGIYLYPTLEPTAPYDLLIPRETYQMLIYSAGSRAIKGSWFSPNLYKATTLFKSQRLPIVVLFNGEPSLSSSKQITPPKDVCKITGLCRMTVAGEEARLELVIALKYNAIQSTSINGVILGVPSVPGGKTEQGNGSAFSPPTTETQPGSGTSAVKAATKAVYNGTKTNTPADEAFVALFRAL
ncbi:expressed unknown protein [Seminavis robusta]|uniref:Uncharacterized protein n=1 Tax=Seminavis robusta TaxID=568900 RepID=A0A9N8HL17_9STRA|nr:expressed unknown protein [Seminavis robusta]|eukprot:Sro792_g203110.1 n/a (399) ;mRNA; r:23631-24897